MLDAQNALATPVTIRREDYAPPAWAVPSVDLEFDLAAERTRVRATLEVTRVEPVSYTHLTLPTICSV